MTTFNNRKEAAVEYLESKLDEVHERAGSSCTDPELRKQEYSSTEVLYILHVVHQYVTDIINV